MRKNEKRAVERVFVSEPKVLRNGRIVGWVEDLSPNGARICYNYKKTAHSKIYFEIRFPRWLKMDTIRIQGRVAWVQEHFGLHLMGIQFTKVDEQDQDRIRHYLSFLNEDPAFFEEMSRMIKDVSKRQTNAVELLELLKRSPINAMDENIEQIYEDIKFSNKVISALDKINRFAKQEIEELDRVIQAQERVSDLARCEMLEKERDIQAHQAVESLAWQELMEKDKIIQAQESVSDLASTEIREKDGFITMYEATHELTKEELKEKDKEIKVREKLLDLSRDELLNKESIINAFENLEELVILEQIEKDKVINEQKIEFGQLRESYNNLMAIDKMKKQFFENISHEIRTPLTMISAPLEMLINEEFGPVNIEQKKFLYLIHSNTEKLLELMNDFLDYSKLEAGKVSARPTRFDLLEMLSKLTMQYKANCELKRIILETRFHAPKQMVTSDRKMLERVFSNLLSNAVKFTPSNGAILITTSLSDKLIHILVKDTGVGIPTEKIHTIFQRFYQIEQEGKPKTEGTGIGLNLVKEFVYLLGGSIDVQSKPNQGTEFRVVLPRTE